MKVLRTEILSIEHFRYLLKKPKVLYSEIVAMEDWNKYIAKNVAKPTCLRNSGEHEIWPKKDSWK